MRHMMIQYFLIRKSEEMDSIVDFSAIDEYSPSMLSHYTYTVRTTVYASAKKSRHGVIAPAPNAPARGRRRTDAHARARCRRRRRRRRWGRSGRSRPPREAGRSRARARSIDDEVRDARRRAMLDDATRWKRWNYVASMCVRHVVTRGRENAWDGRATSIGGVDPIDPRAPIPRRGSRRTGTRATKGRERGARGETARRGARESMDG